MYEDMSHSSRLILIFFQKPIEEIKYTTFNKYIYDSSRPWKAFLFTTIEEITFFFEDIVSLTITGNRKKINKNKIDFYEKEIRASAGESYSMSH